VLDVPVVVRNKARAVGAQGWLDALPQVLEQLASEWSVTVGAAYPDPTEAFVVQAALPDATPAVIKLVIPRDGDAARNEITALRLADGRGCPRLLRADPERGAMLLERLGRPLYQLGLGLTARHEVLCATAEAIWRPAPRAALPSGADKGRRLAEFIPTAWEELDRPCTEVAVEQALACAARRVAAHSEDRAVLVHGDVHQWNALQAGGGFKLVDPDGLLAEPEYDLGILMREDPEDLLGTDSRVRAGWLADRTGLDAAAIWEWGVVERVSTGLLATRIDLQPVGRQMLAVADQVATTA
jgi:streptomycin 6-kinase